MTLRDFLNVEEIYNSKEKNEWGEVVVHALIEYDNRNIEIAELVIYLHFEDGIIADCYKIRDDMYYCIDEFKHVKNAKIIELKDLL